MRINILFFFHVISTEMVMNILDHLLGLLTLLYFLSLAIKHICKLYKLMSPILKQKL